MKCLITVKIGDEMQNHENVAEIDKKAIGIEKKFGRHAVVKPLPHCGFVNL